MRLFVVTVMNEYTISKLNRPPRGNRITAILVSIVKEVSKAKGIRSKQAIAASVPIGGVTKAFRAIEDSDAERLPIDDAVNVHPVGALTPYLCFTFAALRTDHGSGGRIQFGSETKGENALFRIAKLDWSLTGTNDKLTVDRA